MYINARAINFHLQQASNISYPTFSSRLLQLLVVLTVLALFFYFLLYAMGMQDSSGAPDYSWLKTRNLTAYVRPYERTTLMEPKGSNACKKEERLRVAAMVFSAPNNFERRRAVRESWGAGLKGMPGVKLFFLLGVLATAGKGDQTQALLEMEQRQHNDLVQEDFVDSYANLTIKTSFMLKWVTSNECATAKFLFKVDDDTFVNPVVFWENLVLGLLNSLFFLRFLNHIFSTIRRSTRYSTLPRQNPSCPTCHPRLRRIIRRKRERKLRKRR